MIATALVFALLIVATATDLACHKIYNWTTYPGILVALALNGAGALAESRGWLSDGAGTLEWLGCVGFVQSLAGLVACGFCMLLSYVFFRVGGGDVKLMAMLGSCLGLERGIEVLLWTFVVGGCMALVILVWRIGFVTLLGRIGRQVAVSLRFRYWQPLGDEERAALQPPLYLAPSALTALGIVEVAPRGW